MVGRPVCPGTSEAHEMVKLVIRRKAVTQPPAPVVQEPKPDPWARKPPGALLDGQCRFVMSKGPNGVVSWWLMAAYAYEVLNRPIVSDAMFDEMGRVITETWDEITHPHKDLLRRDSMKTALGVKIPDRAKYAVGMLIKDVWGETVVLR